MISNENEPSNTTTTTSPSSNSNNNNNNNTNFIQKLDDLKTLKSKMQQLDKIKQQISHNSETIKNEEALIDEFRAEKEHLIMEQKQRMSELRAIQNDISQVDAVIQAAENEKADMQQAVDQIINEQYYPVKESIDGIRLALGLPRLPSLQEESDKLQASYLEKRRKNWNADETPAPATRNTKKRKKG